MNINRGQVVEYRKPLPRGVVKARSAVSTILYFHCNLDLCWPQNLKRSSLSHSATLM